MTSPEPGTRAAETLEVEGISKHFTHQTVLDGVDLRVEPGEFLTLLGPSGCGKTTLLRIISGLETADSGRVRIGDADVTREPPERRPFNMVFQSYALFPHLTVADNVAYGLRVKGVSSRSRQERVSSALDMVDLAQLGDRNIAQLSGGQRQRVALARALVNRPAVLLLDEPLGALDLQLRKRLQEELRQVQQRLGTTFVFVTHDQEEALSMSDRIAVMQRGRFAQVGTPEEIYRTPRTPFVASFIGEANLAEATVVAASPDSLVRFPGGSATCVLAASDSAPAPDSTVTLAVRPEHLAFADASLAHFTGRVTHTSYVGTVRRYRVTLADGTAFRVSQPADEPAVSGEVGLRVLPGKAVALEPEVLDHA